MNLNTGLVISASTIIKTKRSSREPLLRKNPNSVNL
ncbi:hypothetical protein VPH159E362A_0013 [Vibrio phage 159E36-2a]